MADNTAAGESIRVLRTLASMTLDDVATRAHTSPAYLSRVETGKANPTPQWVGNVTSVIASILAGKTAA